MDETNELDGALAVHEVVEPPVVGASGTGGSLSPRAPVTLPAETREAAGVPAAAASFCFAYPAEGLEDALELLNLANEPWAFFLLSISPRAINPRLRMHNLAHDPRAFARRVSRRGL